MTGPGRIETDRLLLRRPQASDAEAVFARYSSDPEVTRYLAWPRHETIGHARGFLAFSETEWNRWPAGPYLIELRPCSRQTGAELIGSTGLSFETLQVAATGYVLARDAWGRGYATEALGAIVAVVRELALQRLYAHCHPDNRPSQRVLEKCGFTLEGRLAQNAEFPNRGRPGKLDVLSYVLATSSR